MAVNQGLAEWRRAWPVPFTGSIGYASSATFAYSFGVLLGPMTASLGWSRTLFSSAFLLQMLASLVIQPVLGRVVDRVGPRRVALFGLLPAAVGLSLLGLSTPSRWSWWGLCLLLALFTAPISPTVWITGVARSFDRARGLALGVALAGGGLGSMVWPLLAALAVGAVGWRLAFSVLAGCWLLVLAPATIAGFRIPAHPVPVAGSPPSAPAPGRAMLSPSFFALVLAAGLFTVATYGLTLSMVPILRGNGLGLDRAAACASLIGLFSIAGRIATGFLLDRAPVRLVAVAAFLLPLPAIAMLLHRDAGLAPVAAVLLGIASGAETDVVSFVVARRYGGSGFASLYSVLFALLGVGASLGPLLAGGLFDLRHSYRPFLLVSIPLLVVASVLIALVPMRAQRNGARFVDAP